MNTTREKQTASPIADGYALPRLDLPRLRAALRDVEPALRQHKGLIRRADPQETRPLWSQLRRLKREATLLCAIQAHRRGRLHLRRCLRSHAHLGLPQIEVFTFELQARLIGDAWRPYQLTEAGAEPGALSSAAGAA